MGWNSWNTYDCGVNASVLLSTAQVVASVGLQSVGSTYINSDDCWAMPTRANGGFGPQVPNPAKFPNGWPPVVQAINALGLKAGLYTSRSSRTCAGYAGSCLHELIDAQQYQEWGIEYLKDDSCGACGQYVEDDYFRMQSSIDFAFSSQNRTPAMVLSIEGNPDITLVNSGYTHGNMRRVGHDIKAYWTSMTSLVDIGSGLWPYAHGGAQGGFWNDLDMLEVGVAPDFVPENGPQYVQMARAHLGMWAIMKAPLIMGNDVSAMGNLTLATLTNPEVIAINQDALGVQAQRVGSWTPRNTSIAPPWDAAALITPCNASLPTQTWSYRPFAPNATNLVIAACSASNRFQQWAGFSAAAGTSILRNVGADLCLDANVSPGYYGHLTTCTANASQLFFLSPATHVQLNNSDRCLDVFDFQGPDTFVGICKPPGDGDLNQNFSFNATTGLLHSAVGPDVCLETQMLQGGQVWTTDAAGTQWCLEVMWMAAEGSYILSPCDPTMMTDSQIWTLSPPPAGLGNYTLSNSNFGGALGWNAQFGASGPLPHSRWLTANPDPFGGNTFTWNPSAGGPARANNDSIIDDDCVGHVTSGGDFCLDAQRAGNLEMWAGPLSGNRFAVALFNRAPAEDTITADFALIPGLANGAQATFALRDVWNHVNLGNFTGSYSALVPAHSLLLMTLTPA
jgi:Alpha galactosidase A/Alpha galactosidase C-terminal beta sandwich domain/Ricin-type beta-trefoil lectin domain